MQLFSGLRSQLKQLKDKLKKHNPAKNPKVYKEILDAIEAAEARYDKEKTKRQEKLKAKESAAKVEDDAVIIPKKEFVEEHEKLVKELEPMVEEHKEQGAELEEVKKEAAPKCAVCGVEFMSYLEYQKHREDAHGAAREYTPMDPLVKKDVVKNVEKNLGPAIISEQKPKFKIDDKVEPIRGGTGSWGHVMREGGVNGDPLVYVKWMEGPIKEKHGEYGGYYEHDLKAKMGPKIEEQKMEEPKQEVTAEVDIYADLKANYLELLKDLKDERQEAWDKHDHAWVSRLDQKIKDLEEKIKEKFANEKEAVVRGPHFMRKIDKAVPGHGYVATDYDLATGRFRTDVPLKINDTNVRMTDPTKSQFEVRYDGADWKLISEQEFNRWLADWKALNEANYKIAESENGSGGTEYLKVLDHTTEQSNDTSNAGGKDSHDEYQDMWANSDTHDIDSSLITIATKVSIFKHDFDALPLINSKKFGGYDISQNGSKILNIKPVNGQPMTKEQLEWAVQRELTDGYKQAKLTSDVGFMKAGSKVWIISNDGKRAKFANLEEGIRGYVPSSKIRLMALESQTVMHGTHQDKVLGSSKSETLLDCLESGPIWVSSTELLNNNRPHATPESLNDLESAQSFTPGIKARISGGSGIDSDKIVTIVDSSLVKTDGRGIPTNVSGAYKPVDWKREVAIQYEDGSIGLMFKNRLMPIEQTLESAQGFPLTHFTRPEVKQRADQFGLIDVEDHDLTPAGLAAKKHEMIEGHDIEAAPKTDQLVEEFKAKYPEHNGWAFAYEYPGYYAFYSPDHSKTVYFTPDFNEEGVVDVQVIDSTGEFIDGQDIPYQAPLTADALFAIVKPFLDCGSEKESLQTQLPPAILNQRTDVNAAKKSKSRNGQKETCWSCGEKFMLDDDYTGDKCENCRGSEVEGSLNKVARVVHRDDGWHVLSEKGKNLGGPYDSKEKAISRLKQVEYFKHKGSIKPFCKKQAIDEQQKYFPNRVAEIQRDLRSIRVDSINSYNKLEVWLDTNPQIEETLFLIDSITNLTEQALESLQQLGKQSSIKKAEVLSDPYQVLTDHVTSMRERMVQVQERLQSSPLPKQAGEEDNSTLDLPELLSDLTMGIDLLETKLGGDDIDPELHAGVENLENLLYSIEMRLGITPKPSPEEKAEPKHTEIIEEVEKESSVEMKADNVNTPPTSQAPQGMRWAWDTQNSTWILVTIQGGTGGM